MAGEPRHHGHDMRDVDLARMRVPREHQRRARPRDRRRGPRIMCEDEGTSGRPDAREGELDVVVLAPSVIDADDGERSTQTAFVGLVKDGPR